MTHFVEIEPSDLSKVAYSYIYEPAKYFPFERYIWQQMASYNGPFGHSMLEHLNRTASDFRAVLDHLNYDPAATVNLASAMRLHDAGKILQDPSLWGLEDKPSEDIRRARADHSRLGLDVLDRALDRFVELRRDPHMSVIACLMKYHHDRINGAGPNGISGNTLGEPLEVAGIVDTLDGKLIARGGQRTSLAQALRDMTGDPALSTKDKHKGEFRTSLLMDAITYYQTRTDEPILAPRRQHSPAAQPVLAL